MLLLIYMTHKQGLVLIPGKVSFFIPGKVVPKMDIIIRYSGIANKQTDVNKTLMYYKSVARRFCYFRVV